MANNRTLAGLGYIPSLTDNQTYVVTNAKWAVYAGGSAGAWADLTLASGVTAGSPKPQYRKNGDVVELRGVALVTAGNNATGRAITTLPAGFRPAYQPTNAMLVMPGVADGSSPAVRTPISLIADSTGLIQALSGTGIATNGRVWLDGIRYTTLS